ncbi:MAG TPA: protein kinase, partial [Gemmatimonadaceae bacterium]|nr:protein kinase [Gemmatimonadaceae bacterium]
MCAVPYYNAMDLGDRLQQALGKGYVIERELGGGGMSRVFLVTELDLDRKIVLKVLPPDLAAGLSVERFKREIQLAAKLQHPHIVPLLIAGAKDGLLYYAMPFISGEALRSRLAKQHELPIPESIRILRDVADALAYAHANGVVHRDIKPDNVLISGQHALVTDFGVSKALANSTGESSITSVGIALGTPAYMSPEQASADPSVDHRADIYSLGALAYELLTGQPPFSGLPPAQMLAAHVARAPDPVSMHRESVPPALEHVVMRCLEKKRADRWQSADELLVQLEALATPSAGLTPTNIALGKTSSPLRWGAAAAGAALITLVAVALWWMARIPPPYVVTSTAQITNSPGLELDAALSPDGALVAYTAGPVGHARIVVRQIAGGTARFLTDSALEPQRTPRWSPDGQQISFVVGQSLYAAPAFGGSARRLMDASGYAFASPALSPDGATVA